MSQMELKEQYINELPVNRQVPQEEDTISLLDLLGVLAKRWKFIFFSTLFAAILIFSYALYTRNAPKDAPFNMLPNVYKSEVLIRLQEDEGTVSSILSQSGVSDLLGISGLPQKTSSVALAQDLLQGKTILDQVAEEFNFRERFNITENYEYNSRNILRNSIETEYNSDSGILTISYEDTDPEFAAKVVNRLVFLLEQRFKNFTTEKITNKKSFLEERLEEVKAELQKAQDKLISFQVEHGIVNIEGQEAGGGFVFSQYIPRERRYEIISKFYDLMRDRNILEGIYELLLKEYETTKIQALDDSKTFQILEQAEVPQVKAGPSRAKICIIVTITVFFLAIFLSFIMEYFERVKKDPIESRKLEEIKHSLGHSRRKL
ncbi:MAG: hypothetical protein DRP87_14250 [Spirochaetes bacterium]|nr:MAG: hypothetical protein DRP87_14250 [Spirochaetota bacterium]